ncbi:hypothetical protein ES703_41364 [subsurface metagenome]
MFTRFYDFRVVFDHKDRVPNLLQGFEDFNKTVVVPGVESEARLVQDKKGSDERSAQCGGQVNPLCLTSAQGESHPFQGDIVQADL